jgi:3-hydroxybutyryl-CoA dehydrogenase
MKAEDIGTVGNLGTGTMGFGTALLFSMAGCSVRMFGRSDASLERGFWNIRAALAVYREHGLVGAEEIPPILDRIQGVKSIEEAGVGADFVIESIAEDLEIKRAAFQKIEAVCRPDAILATNTSGLSPTAIAEGLKFPERFVVAHFWNPPHLVPLVEVVPGEKTSQETAAVTWKLMERLGKKPVALKREALGFIGNRMQLALLREAIYIVETGIADPEAVDTAMKYSMGRRLSTTGPLESADLGGLDVFHSISSYLLKDVCNDPGVPAALEKAMATGALGAKTGSGFYAWTPERLARVKKTRENILIEWLKKDKSGMTF